MRYLIPVLHDLGEMLKGRRLASIEFYEAARKSLHFFGYEGMAMIAVAGVDMVGGSIGAVPAYNSNGLWLRSPEEVANSCSRRQFRGGAADARPWRR
jgi:mandelate racemase